MNTKSKNYCYTFNNYTEEDYENILLIPCVYHIVAREIGEKEGTPHLQGFIIFKSQRYFNSVCKLLKGCHVEKCRGSPLQNIEYCKKQGNFYEIGEPPVGQGRRTDIQAVKEMVKQQMPLIQVLENVSSYQAFNFAEKLYKYIEFKREWKTEVLWFYGPTASGKSRAANNILPEAYWKSPNNKWWDGYDSHEHVIIDDIRPDFCTFNEMLRLLDRYPYTIEFKGGSRQFLAKRLVITCPYSPDEFYKGLNNEDIDQFRRRIDILLKFPI